MNNLTYCSNCVTPNSRPGLTFDSRGFCNACQNADLKRSTDWTARAVEFKTYIADILVNADPERDYDCVMTVSGGKDSTFQAWYAKNVLGIRALCVRIQPLAPKDFIAEHNFHNIATTIGLDSISIVNNKHVFSRLARKCLIEYGNPYIPYYYNIYFQCAKVAHEKKVPIVIIGENGETEYGGNPSFNFLTTAGVDLRIGRGYKNFIPSSRWVEWGFSRAELAPYTDIIKTSVVDSDNLYRFFMSDFVPWNNNEHLHYSLNIIGGFKTLGERSTGSYSHGFGIEDDLDDIYLWLMWLKFGIHRANKYASTDIREGKLSRVGAIELVRLYDGEFPWHCFSKVIEVLNISELDFWVLCQKFIGDSENLTRLALEQGKDFSDIVPAWKKIGPNKWIHVNTVHGEERVLELPVRRSVN